MGAARAARTTITLEGFLSNVASRRTETWTPRRRMLRKHIWHGIIPSRAGSMLLCRRRATCCMQLYVSLRSRLVSGARVHCRRSSPPTKMSSWKVGIRYTFVHVEECVRNPMMAEVIKLPECCLEHCTSGQARTGPDLRVHCFAKVVLESLQ